jgi:L-threonylcarbamoyladenylate synthase
LKTEHIKITDVVAQEGDLSRAAAILRAGGLVVFPTETVYGLGGDATRDEAAKKIYAAKGRPSDNPLIIHIADPADAEAYAVTNALYYRLAKAFMPGPLTVILPRKESIPTSTTGGLDSVAVRCPLHPVAHKLIELCGVAIAAPSANLSGKPSPTSAAHVAQDMDGRVDMIIDGGESEIGLESTIVKIDGDGLILLRPGGITYDALSLVCEKVTIADAVMHKLAENERPLSPGMKYRHYAPTAPLVLLAGKDEDVLAYVKAETRKCAILSYDEECEALAGRVLFPIGKKDDLGTQARRLFAALREADTTDAEIIYAHLPPQEGLGLALYNRLIRAAAHTVKEV